MIELPVVCSLDPVAQFRWEVRWILAVGYEDAIHTLFWVMIIPPAYGTSGLPPVFREVETRKLSTVSLDWFHLANLGLALARLLYVSATSCA